MHNGETRRVMPHSLEAEQSVLGGLMLENDRWDEIAPLLAVDSFFSSSHQKIFAAMQALLGRNMPIDLITVSEELERLGQLDIAGGFAYVAELSKNTPSAANIVAYAEYVSTAKQKRQLLALGHDLAGQAEDVRTDVSALMEEAERRLFDIAGLQAAGKQFDMVSSLETYLNRLEKRCASEDLITGTPTPFEQLNGMTSGLQESDLILLAGRPSMGKTALALSLCEGALDSRKEQPVQIYSLEMPIDQLLSRFISMLGRVPLQNLRSGNMDDEDWARVSKASNILLTEWKDRLLIDDDSFMTPSMLRSRVRKNVRKHGRPSLILLDYLQLMRCPGQENRTLEIAEISRSLKALAKEIGCPVVALSQLNRALENRADKRPNNGDLRDSGALEQDADVIMFIYRDEVYDEHSPDKGIAELIIGKQRNGPIGTVKVKYQADITRFEDFLEGRYDF
ncbi:SPI-7-type island replicative DNA helicase [Serratia fonticola]|uniref:Replicative DNA helicase n=1 Tax=Serratia fonticola TaxID=47917 RepID=A0AAW3WKP2_SERFO|nr:SPI-7-type island replicative DNA helicase [Serratia fonticola]MBC3211076.1 replicative DNA helicase [Serratia fonticola]NYA12058.1 replicative DNA helicase [Serratia fonticola]NYA31637.1 replicative DNA helicase [Serratia fonticola]